MVTRLVPLFPFNLQNFAYGLTRIPFWTYLGVSAVCILPGTIAFTLAAGALQRGARRGPVDPRGRGGADRLGFAHSPMARTPEPGRPGSSWALTVETPVVRLSIVVPVLDEARHLEALLADLPRLGPASRWSSRTAGARTEAWRSPPERRGPPGVERSRPGAPDERRRGSGRRATSSCSSTPTRGCRRGGRRRPARARRPDGGLRPLRRPLRQSGGRLPADRQAHEPPLAPDRHLHGDQAIFVRRAAFLAVGGYPEIALMEDIELTRRLKRVGRLAPLGLPVTTSARKWERDGVARTVVLMWTLRFLYLCGVGPDPAPLVLSASRPAAAGDGRSARGASGRRRRATGASGAPRWSGQRPEADAIRGPPAIRQANHHGSAADEPASTAPAQTTLDAHAVSPLGALESGSTASRPPPVLEPARYRRTNRRSMRSLSHHAKREWLTTPCQRRRALPSAVLRSDRKVRCGTYGPGSPPRGRRAGSAPAPGPDGPRTRRPSACVRVVGQGRAVARPQTGAPFTARSVASTSRKPRPSSGSPARARRRARGAGEPDDQIRRGARSARELDGARLHPARPAAYRDGNAASGEDARRAAAHRRRSRAARPARPRRGSPPAGCRRPGCAGGQRAPPRRRRRRPPRP